MVYRSRQELHEALFAAFIARPEVYQIHAFGREADGEVDQYSDLDWIVSTADVAATQAAYPGILASFAPVVGTWTIHTDAMELAQMVQLEGFSPYQKIDLSIMDCPQRKGDFGPLKCLLDRPRIACPPTQMTHTAPRDTLTNRLNNTIFSVPRFTKCLFRHDRDFFRRWNGMMETMLVLLYESYVGWSRTAKNRLSPPEYKSLWMNLRGGDHQLVDAVLPLNSPPDLPGGFATATRTVVALYQRKANALGEPIDLRLANYILPFMTDELRRFANPTPTAQ